MRLFTLSCLFLVLLLCSPLSFAQVPRTLSYQGILADTTGVPKPDGNYDLTFRLYETENGGSAIWMETKAVEVKTGLFSTQLGDKIPFGAAVRFDKPYWLSVQVSSLPELAPRIPLSAVAYSLNTPSADSARIAGTVPNNSITSAKIANGAIQLADLAQNGASDGQVLKWSSGAWTTAADEVGTSGTAGGWTDAGTTVRLASASDTVSLNTTLRLGRFNLNGDIGLNGESNVFFGSVNSFLGATPGENLTLRANNDLSLKSVGGMTLLAGDNLNIGHFGDETWLKVDNTNKRLGIGMGGSSIYTVDDRLHVMNDLATPCWLRIESAHPTNWGQAGLRIKTPQNTWNLRMDLYSNANLPNGALSLHSQDANKEVMTWLEDGNVGVGTKNPTRKLYVSGSAEVKDTLYAGTINAGRVMNGPGLVSINYLDNPRIQRSWSAFDSVSIQVPGPGYVLILFSGNFYSNHNYADFTTIEAAITTGRSGGGRLNSFVWNLDVKLPSGEYEIPAALHAVAHVPSSGTYDYFVCGIDFVNDAYDRDEVHVTNSIMSALFIPASYGTVDTAPKPPGGTSDFARLTEAPATSSESIASRVSALTAELEAVKKALAAQSK